ncbi:hypothetical protein HELRODRAFT_193535 [Helobdella robusta]|uniref:WW domain-containing protein n=1 Tax=Helobdella robusta TaxID=6412 RepID=T1FV36_HELRO|nr:hypothetical protein HELRODRAFT_193535 [Helobdella robusta]ESN95540.1 hypothetical protein HELRODRAFT_193535 [Helobdella robusta]
MTEMPFGRDMRFDSKIKKYYFLDHKNRSTSWDDPRLVLWKEWVDVSMKLGDSQLRDERIINTIHPTVCPSLIRCIFIATNFNVHQTCKILSDMGYNEMESLINAKAKLKTCLSPNPASSDATGQQQQQQQAAAKTTTTTSSSMSVPKSAAVVGGGSSSSSTTPRTTTPKSSTPQTATPKLSNKKNASLPYSNSEMEEDITILQILESTSLNSGEIVEETAYESSDPTSSSSSLVAVHFTNTPRKMNYVGPNKNLCVGPNPTLACGPDPVNHQGPDPQNVQGPQGSNHVKDDE